MVPLAKHPTYTHDGAGLRKHADPPKLWMWLVAGSIAFHVGLWLMLPTLLRAAARSSAATAATPIEFVDISTVDAATSPSVSPPTATSSEATPSATQANPTAAPLAEPFEAAQPPSIQPQPALEPNIAFSPELQPIPTPSPEVFQPDSAPNPAIAPQPSGIAEPPAPQQPPASAPQPESSPPPQAPAPTTPESQLPVGNDPSSGLQGEALPPVPTIPETFPGDVAANPGPTNPNLEPGDIANPDGYDDGIGEIAVSGEAAPTNLQANIISFGTVPLEENPTDIPEQPAQAIQTSMSFVSDPMTPGSCIVPPESVPWFGAEVAIRVTVGADGRVLQTQVRESPGGPDYAELAECLIRQWQFNPANTSGIPVVSDNLIVYLTVNRL